MLPCHSTSTESHSTAMSLHQNTRSQQRSPQSHEGWGWVGGLSAVFTPVGNENQNQIHPWIFPQTLLLGHHSLSFPRLLGFNIQVQFSAVAQSCLTLCNSMDCSTPGFPVHQQLPGLAQTHNSLLLSLFIQNSFILGIFLLHISGDLGPFC